MRHCQTSTHYQFCHRKSTCVPFNYRKHSSKRQWCRIITVRTQWRPYPVFQSILNVSSGLYNVTVAYNTAPSCQVAYANNPVQINGVNYRKTNIVAGTSPFQDSMWIIDLENYVIVKRLAPSIPGFTITGINGLATHPITGEHYAILKLSGVSGRVLAKINFLTGVCTSVGNLGDNFATISFRDDGQLFGVTGDGANVPETMYLIDHTNATKTVATALGNGADGEVICHVPEDNAFYHWSGNGTVVFEKLTTPHLIQLPIYRFQELQMGKPLAHFIWATQIFGKVISAVNSNYGIHRGCCST